MMRRVRRSPTAAFVTLGAALLLVSPLAAQQRRPLDSQAAGRSDLNHDDDWDDVRRLTPGTSVRVVQKTGRADQGPIAAVSDGGIMIGTRTPVDVQRSAILRVDLVTVHRSRGRGAGLGFWLGAAAGAVFAGSTVKTNKHAWVPLLAGGWGGIGALLGALEGRTTVRYTTLYRASAAADQPTTPAPTDPQRALR